MNDANLPHISRHYTRSGAGQSVKFAYTKFEEAPRQNFKKNQQPVRPKEALAVCRCRPI